MKNSISFVIPAYNCENTIKESIDSIMLTNFTNGDEIIVVDDASTDDTLQVINQLAKYYPIKIIRNRTNRGCPASRNIGINKAKNPLIFNLDSDDVLEKGSVLRLKKYRQEVNADVAAFSEIHFFKTSIHKITHKWICPTHHYSLADFLSGPISPGGNYLYTKASWKRVGGYDEYGKGLHEYWGFGLKQIALGSKFFALPNSYYFHRYGHLSLFARENTNTMSNLLATKMIAPFLDLLNPDDAAMIQGIDGSQNWFTNLNRRSIRTKDGHVGRKGWIWYPFSWHVVRKLNRFVLMIKQFVFNCIDFVRNLGHGYYFTFLSRNTVHFSSISVLKHCKFETNVNIQQHVIIRSGNDKVFIGSNTQINPFVVIYGGSGVRIGKNVMIAPHVIIASGNHNYKQVSVPMREATELPSEPIIIEDDVWIGGNACITDEVRIGKGAVIGAGAVVTTSIAPYAVAVGIPAKVIKYRR